MSRRVWDAMQGAREAQRRVARQMVRETLADALKARGLSYEAVAQKVGVTPKKVRLLAEGKAPLTPRIAEALERAYGTSAEYWLSLVTPCAKE